MAAYVFFFRASWPFHMTTFTRSTCEQGEVWERARKSVHPNGGVLIKILLDASEGERELGFCI